MSYVVLGHLTLWLRVVWRWVLRWGIIFSRRFCGNSFFFSLGGVFTLASVLSAWRHDCVFVTLLKRQTRMSTSWNVSSLYRSEQDVRAVKIWRYWGRNEDVLWSSWTVCKRCGRVMDGSGRNGNEIELVAKRT